jgi:hypothetical protein
MCPSCGASTIPRVEVGTLYPYRGYEMSFADFQRLLSDSTDRQAVAPLLREWFGYELEEAGGEVSIRAQGGEEIEPIALHLSIQEDGPRQLALYQTAMTLWK